MNLIHEELTYKIRGVLFDVYNQLGPNLPERFYQPAIAIGLEHIEIACETEKQFAMNCLFSVNTNQLMIFTSRLLIHSLPNPYSLL
jgi:hypothetical protein